ncbi:MAG TPA: sensor histidine kinase [Actinomycetota bacterium]|nr:sensor histidine kinase [Actinomycetota bacterium]
MSNLAQTPPNEGTFVHEALFYAGDDEFTDRMSRFVRDSITADEPVLVMVVDHKIELIRSALGRDADKAMFADMREIGRNPGRIISRWHDFVDEQVKPGTRVRGIGEPIWSGRSREELVEAQRHESLINMAFKGAPAWILCPYDTEALSADVIEEAHRSHPVLSTDGIRWDSYTYTHPGECDRRFDEALPEPKLPFHEVILDVDRLQPLRKLVERVASGAGVDEARTRDFVLAVTEIATNSLRHGGTPAVIRVWAEEECVICEVRDTGRIENPLVGRKRPEAEQAHGYGVWLANELCDLVQVRFFTSGSVLRLHMRTGAP